MTYFSLYYLWSALGYTHFTPVVSPIEETITLPPEIKPFVVEEISTVDDAKKLQVMIDYVNRKRNYHTDGVLDIIYGP